MFNAVSTPAGCSSWAAGTCKLKQCSGPQTPNGGACVEGCQETHLLHSVKSGAIFSVLGGGHHGSVAGGQRCELHI